MKSKIRFHEWIAVFAGVLLSISPDWLCALPQKVLYQGTLRRSGTIFTGSGTFLFRVTDATGASEYWTSGSTVVAVTAGLFRYPLGVDNLGGTGLNSKPFANIPWALIEPYVEVTVDGILLSPREPLSSVPYALYFTTGDTFSVAGSTFMVAGGKVGIGTTSPATKLHMSSGTLTVDGNATAGLQVFGSTFVVYLNGNVGIGTSAPIDRLHLSVNSGQTIIGSWGCGAGYSGLGFSTTLTGCARYSILGEGSHTYLNRPTGGTMFFRENNSTQMVILPTSGNVGIGTTLPQGRLEVRPSAAENYSLYVSSQDAAPILTVDKAGDVFIGAPATHDLTSSQDLHVAGNVIVDGQFIGHTASGSSVTFTSGGDFIVGTSTLVVTSGNIGIGTTAPAARLDVRSDANIGGVGAQGTLRLYASAAAGTGSFGTLSMDNSNLGRITIGGGGGSASVLNELAITAGTIPGSDNTYTLGSTARRWSSLRVGTSDSSFAGWVGIGTTLPQGPIHVSNSVGNASLFQADTAADAIRARNAQSAANATTGLLFQLLDGAGNVENYGAVRSGITNSADGSEQGFLSLFTRDAGTVQERLRITAPGNVGIGITNPKSALDLSGGALTFGSAASSSTIRQDLTTDDLIIASHRNAADSDIIFRTQGPNAADTRMVLTGAGNLGIGLTNPGETLHVSGSIRRNAIRQLTLSRSLNGTTVGNFTNIGTFAQTVSGIYAKLKLYGTVANTVQMVEFEFHNTDYPTQTGWIELPLKSGMRFGGSHNFAVDVRQTASNAAVDARIRLLQTNATEVLPLTIELETNTTFTSDATSGAGATVVAGYLAQESFQFPVSLSRWTNSTAGLFISSTGSVGIGTTSPAAKLDVPGGVKIANDAAACSSANAGTVRFNGTNFQVCRSNAWYRFDVDSTQASIFSYTGADQSYTVPAGVTSIQVKLWGAGGGGGNHGGWLMGQHGGAGGFSKGTIAVTPGQVLTVIVGQGGHDGSDPGTSASYGGGGRSCGGSDCQYSGQGGGRSAIRNATPVELITAGGGGGGGATNAADYNEHHGGAGGGYSGQDGGCEYNSHYCAGKGGSQSAGGRGGNGVTRVGTTGGAFAGGQAGGAESYGGAGGGGWYGGGGGGYHSWMGGGGGGSGYVGGAGVSNAVTIAGNRQEPPATLDYHYTGGIGVGGGRKGNNVNTPTTGGNGLVVITPD